MSNHSTNPRAVVSTTENKPVFFDDASNENAYLSSSFLADITEYNCTFNCNEQLLQKFKAFLFKDASTKAQIMAAKDPKVQRNLGEQVKNFDQETWDKGSYHATLRVNQLKFNKNVDLREKLIATGHREIVYASADDGVWGVGLALVDAEKQRGPWPGRNRLGQLLMRLRGLYAESEVKVVGRNGKTDLDHGGDDGAEISGGESKDKDTKMDEDNEIEEAEESERSEDHVDMDYQCEAEDGDDDENGGGAILSTTTKTITITITIMITM